MLAGLPKAPSLFNPLVNPKRATERQRYILRRMHEVGFLDQSDARGGAGGGAKRRNHLESANGSACACTPTTWRRWPGSSPSSCSGRTSTRAG